mgnify:CR=1 FL=1
MIRSDLEGLRAGVDLQAGFMCSLAGDSLSSWSEVVGRYYSRKSVGDERASGCVVTLVCVRSSRLGSPGRASTMRSLRSSLIKVSSNTRVTRCRKREGRSSKKDNGGSLQSTNAISSVRDASRWAPSSMVVEHIRKLQPASSNPRTGKSKSSGQNWTKRSR